MHGFPPGLVWLASYPKSGNTWLRVLLANLASGRAEPADINDLGEEETLVGRWRFGDDTLVDADLLDPGELARMRALHADHVADTLAGPMFCKTHDRFDGETGGPVLGTRARAAVYLLRDPRDVAVSLSYHWSTTLDRVVAAMTDPTFHHGGGAQVRYPLGDWAGHVSGWVGQTLVRTLVLRYEDLHADTEAALRRISSFLGGDATAPDVACAVRRSSLPELQRQEASKGFRESQPGQAQFFRSGRVGEWREVMSLAQVRVLEDRFGPVMARWGYGPAT